MHPALHRKRWKLVYPQTPLHELSVECFLINWTDLQKIWFPNCVLGFFLSSWAKLWKLPCCLFFMLFPSTMISLLLFYCRGVTTRQGRFNEFVRVQMHFPGAGQVVLSSGGACICSCLSAWQAQCLTHPGSAFCIATGWKHVLLAIFSWICHQLSLSLWRKRLLF